MVLGFQQIKVSITDDVLPVSFTAAGFDGYESDDGCCDGVSSSELA